MPPMSCDLPGLTYVRAEVDCKLAGMSDGSGIVGFDPRQGPNSFPQVQTVVQAIFTSWNCGLQCIYLQVSFDSLWLAE